MEKKRAGQLEMKSADLEQELEAARTLGSPVQVHAPWCRHYSKCVGRGTRGQKADQDVGVFEIRFG